MKYAIIFAGISEMIIAILITKNLEYANTSNIMKIIIIIATIGLAIRATKTLNYRYRS